MSGRPGTRVRVSIAVAGFSSVVVLGCGVTSVAAAGAAVKEQTAVQPVLAVLPAQKGPAGLPVGAATGFPFGYAMDEGAKISLLPPNDADVNQARVVAAPRVGPWRISVAGGDKGWPSACDLTSSRQLNALLPAIVGVQGAPIGSKGQSAKLVGPPTTTPNDVRCRWDVKTTFTKAGYAPSWVGVYLDEVDANSPSAYSQALAQQKTSAAMGHDVSYPWEYADYPNLKYGVKCFDDGSELQCLKDDAFYWVLGQKITGGPEANSDNAVWVDQIELPLAEVVGAELSTTP
jgi:hypothetical protein